MTYSKEDLFIGMQISFNNKKDIIRTILNLGTSTLDYTDESNYKFTISYERFINGFLNNPSYTVLNPKQKGELQYDIF